MGAQCCRSEPIIDPTSTKIICLKESNHRYFIHIFDCNSETSNEIEINPNLFDIKNLSQIYQDNTLYLIGQDSTETEPSSIFIVINTIQSPISINFEQPPIHIHNRPSLCFYSDEELYVIGGINSTQCEMYSIKEKKWNELPQLPSERYGCSVVSVKENHSIILYGGGKDDNDDILIYNKEKQWEILTKIDIQLKRSFTGISSYNNTIFIFGGVDSTTNESSDEIISVNMNKVDNIEKYPMKMSKKSKWEKMFSYGCYNGVFYLFDEESFAIYKVDINYHKSEVIDFYHGKDMEY